MVACVPHERLVGVVPVHLLHVLLLNEDDRFGHHLDAALLRLHVPLCFPVLPPRRFAFAIMRAR